MQVGGLANQTSYQGGKEGGRVVWQVGFVFKGVFSETGISDRGVSVRGPGPLGVNKRFMPAFG